MRRLLIILTAIVLLVGSLAVGLVTADLPFWRRAIDLPLTPGESYSPTVRIGKPAGGGVEELDPAQRSLDATHLETASNLARAMGASSLLVSHRGRLQLEEYFKSPPKVYPVVSHPADFLARPLVAIAAGIAHADGRIGSLDDTVAKYLPEWIDDERGAITIRQLLNETSGLETGAEPAQVLDSHPFADWSGLPRFATSRGVRLLLGNDFESTALGFRMRHEPGGFFNVSPANTQIVAVIVERATGRDYAEFLDERLFAAHFSTTELQLDRRSGMPAAYCCIRADARDALTFTQLFLTDGQYREEYNQDRLWPAGWVGEMKKGSRANPDFGLQLEHLKIGGKDAWRLGGERGGAAWFVPSDELAVVLMAERGARGGAQVIEAVVGALRK